MVSYSEGHTLFPLHRLSISIALREKTDVYQAYTYGLSNQRIIEVMDRIRKKSLTPTRLTIRGILLIEKPDAYTFFLLPRQATHLYIDNRLIQGDSNLKRKKNKSNEVYLDLGLHPFTIEFFSAESRFPFNFLWKPGKDKDRRPIPAELLFSMNARHSSFAFLKKLCTKAQIARVLRTAGYILTVLSIMFLLFFLAYWFRRKFSYLWEKDETKSPSRRIVEIDITKGMAGFLMVLSHIAGRGLFPFGTFGAALFFFCSGMNTILFIKKRVAPATQDATRPTEKIGNGEKVCFFCTFLQGINKKVKGKPWVNFYHIFFATLLFFGGYTQIKIAHPLKTSLFPEFLQLSALAILFVFLLAKLFKNPLFTGYLFPIPFLIHLCYQAGYIPFLNIIGSWKYFLFGPGGFSLFPWSGYFLYGTLLLHVRDKKNGPISVILSTGFLSAITIFLWRIPINKSHMTLSYIFLSLFVVSGLFFFFQFTWSRVREKVNFSKTIQSHLAVVGRNSLMFVYVHYFAIHYLKLGRVSLPLPPHVVLLLQSIGYFVMTLFFLMVYEKVKGRHDLFVPTVLAAGFIAFLRYSGSLSAKMDLRLVDILIGVLFAFLYVQLREILRIILRK